MATPTAKSRNKSWSVGYSYSSSSALWWYHATMRRCSMGCV